MTVTWNVEGENTIGTLLAYAQKLTEWAESIKTADRAAFLRPSADLPHYADDEEQTFVFRHTSLWADANTTELDQYLTGLASVVNQLQRADIAKVRNGLDHRRDDRDFPRADVMLACAARLRDALDMAESHRYLPKVHWLESIWTDRFGRERFVFTDYKGKEVILGGPPVVSGLPGLGFQQPALIAPGNLLGEPNAELRFLIRESSTYSNYWANYPRRRDIPSPHKKSLGEDPIEERTE